MSVCFFTSTGDNLSLIQDISKNYNYDIFVNYYGINNHIYDTIKGIAKYCINYKLSKFQSLYKIYNLINTYDQVIVFDDDAIITCGNINTLIKIMIQYNLDVISSSHDSNGKISYNMHTQVVGDHIYRKVNFIEMNFPILSKLALQKFMMHYDGSLTGWGIDHLYSSLFSNMAICDNVVVLNPKNSNKINNLVSKSDRILEWTNYKQKYKLSNIEPQTIQYYCA